MITYNVRGFYYIRQMSSEKEPPMMGNEVRTQDVQSTKHKS